MPLPQVKTNVIDKTIATNETQTKKVFFAGCFEKGIPNYLTPVYSILDFKIKFGKPNKNNLEDWFIVYNYFQYNNKEIILSRLIGNDSLNSMVSYPFKDEFQRIDNFDEFENNAIMKKNNFLKIFARNPGSWGNDLRIAIFTNLEYINNSLIYKNYTAQSLLNNFLNKDEFCLCIFINDKLIEKWIFNKSQDSLKQINLKSNYIFIIFDFKKCKYFDGNLNNNDGNFELIDGNLRTTKNPTFFGSNCLKLSGGKTTEPLEKQIFDEYFNIGESNEYIFDFVIANFRAPLAAIILADNRQNAGNGCEAFINVPKDENPYNFCESLIKSNNAIVYYGNKLQINPFNNQKIWVSCIGDIVGIRTHLINNLELSSSHCKTFHNFLNAIEIDAIPNEQEIQKLYNNNINVVRKGHQGFYAFSENMLLGQKLTNRIIHNNLINDCTKIMNYYIFEHNDEITRSALTLKLINLCEKYKTDNNINSFKIICDETNNKNSDNNIYADILYSPKNLIEEITINLVANLSIN